MNKEPPPAGTGTKNSVHKEIADWLLHIGAAILVGFLIVNFVIQFVVVHKNSMLPTLQEGNILIIEKIGPRFNRVNRGDLVTLNDVKVFPGIKEVLIKRVIAVENDKIDLRDGNVYINGVEINEGYINGEETLEVKPEFSSLTVPEGSIYVMGDNRLPGESFDSRSIGPVSASTVGGRVLLRLYPLREFGTVK